MRRGPEREAELHRPLALYCLAVARSNCWRACRRASVLRVSTSTPFARDGVMEFHLVACYCSYLELVAKAALSAPEKPRSPQYKLLCFVPSGIRQPRKSFSACALVFAPHRGHLAVEPTDPCFKFDRKLVIHKQRRKCASGHGPWRPRGPRRARAANLPISEHPSVSSVFGSIKRRASSLKNTEPLALSILLPHRKYRLLSAW